MNKQLTAEDIRRAKEATLYNNAALYIVDETGEAYGFHQGGTEWFRKDPLGEPFDASHRIPSLTALTKEEAVQLYEGWTHAPNGDCARLNRAIVYAVEHHAGQFRKGSVLPYIFHPLEVMQLLQTMNADTNLLMAGVLHDTVEDTDATLEEIRELFGEDVAALVGHHSEDKSKTWQERKTHTILELAAADKRLQMLVLADKVANLRSTVTDFEKVGPALWNRFNAGFDKQKWYYTNLFDALKGLARYPECAKPVQEMETLCRRLFEQ